MNRAGALPRGASRRAVVPNCRFRTLRNPKRGKRSAEIRGRGTPHPLADLTVAPVPPAGGNCLSLDLETAFWKRTGAPIRNALDPAGFSPCVHPPPPARCRTDPRSWAGQCLPRPPEVRLRRPNPQAPHPPRSHASHENALGRVGPGYESTSKRTNQEQKTVSVNIARRCRLRGEPPQILQRPCTGG